MIANILTKSKMSKIGVTEMMVYGVLKVVIDRENFNHKSKEDSNEKES